MTEKFNKVVLVTEDNGEVVNFKEMYDVQPEHLGQAIEMAQVFQEAVEYENDILKFNYSKALSYVKANKDMAIIGTLDQTVTQSNNTVSAMVDKVVNLITNVLHAKLPDATVDSYKSSIESAFTNLSEQKDGKWIFWQKEEKKSTTYQYSILYAIQNKSTGSVMLALPISLTIKVDLEKKKVLFVTVRDKHNYSVKVQAMQVVEALK